MARVATVTSVPRECAHRWVKRYDAEGDAGLSDRSSAGRYSAEMVEWRCYDRPMATIQVRDISETAYEVIRRRSRAAGQSIQSYMRSEVERMAATPDRTELFEQIRLHVADQGIAVDSNELLADLESDRR